MTKVSEQIFIDNISTDCVISGGYNKSGSCYVTKYALNGKLVGLRKDGISSGTTYLLLNDLKCNDCDKHMQQFIDDVYRCCECGLYYCVDCYNSKVYGCECQTNTIFKLNEEKKTMTQMQIEDLTIELNLRYGIKKDFISNWLIDNCLEYSEGLALTNLSASQFADKLYGDISI